jgi:hypothetical protein
MRKSKYPNYGTWRVHCQRRRMREQEAASVAKYLKANGF